MNEGRLIFPKMKIDKTPFPVHTNTHTIDLNNAKVLIRPEQAEGAKGKNVVIGEIRPKHADDKILAREVVLEKALDGKELIKITVKAHVSGVQEGASSSSRPAVQDRPVRPVSPTGQTGPPQGRSRTFKPKCPEVGTWKQNVPKDQGRFATQKPTFGQLLNKYTNAVRQDRPLKKRSWSPPRRGGSPMREGPNKHRGDAVTVFPLQRAYATMP